MVFDYEQSIWGRGTASLSWFAPTRERLLRSLLALQNLPSGGRVLEVGCGAGQFIRAVKQLRPGLICCGCDISQRAIQAAVPVGDGVEYLLSQSELLPYADQYFDAVLIFDVLEHVDNPGSILSEVRRVLKRGGIFYCFVPCEGDWTSLWNLLDKFNLKNDLTKKYAGHIQYFSRKQLSRLLSDHGFIILSKRYSGHIVGQLIGVVSCMLMDRSAKKNNTVQMNNEYYFNQLNNRGGFLIKLMRIFVNFIKNLESAIFIRIPSPNLHAICKKW